MAAFAFGRQCYGDFAVQRSRPDASSAHKVKALSLSHRLVIALYSPDGIVKTGLPMCPPEKNAKTCVGSKAGTLLQSFERNS
jgi:hypothetical protein